MKTSVKLMVVTALFALLVIGNVKAMDANTPKEPNAPAVDKQVTVIGKVADTKNEEGTITAVNIVTRVSVTYCVKLDDKGIELGQKMSGKTVKAVGVLTVKDGVKWLTVESYTVIE